MPNLVSMINILRLFTIMDNGIMTLLTLLGVIHMVFGICGIAIISTYVNSMNVCSHAIIGSDVHNFFVALWYFSPFCGICRVSFTKKLKLTFLSGFFFNAYILVVLCSVPECSTNVFLITSSVIFWIQSIVFCVLGFCERYYCDDILIIDSERKKFLGRSCFYSIPNDSLSDI